MAQKKYVDSNGLKKVQSDYVAKIAEAVKDVIKGVTVQGVAGTVAEGTATVDLTSVLAEYAKKTDLDALVGHIALKGSTTKADMTTLKDTATVGDIYIVTDDNSHFYLFVGDGADGADENGFIDLGGHGEIDTSLFLTKAEAESTYVKVEGGVEQLKTELDAAYASKESLDDYVQTSVAEETYAKKTELAGYVETATLEDYVLATDMVALTDAEIEEALGIGAGA